MLHATYRQHKKNPAISHGRGTGIQIDEQLIKIAGSEVIVQGLSTVDVNI